jgi:hypothetical protein
MNNARVFYLSDDLLAIAIEMAWLRPFDLAFLKDL